MRKTQLVIIGQGPAGLSAAIYAARANIDTIVMGLRPKIDGDYDIENYFGFADVVKGSDLMSAGRAQTVKAGAELLEERVLGVHWADDGQGFAVKTETGHYKACSLIIAAGVSRIRPGIKGFEDYDGKGVSYCVSCDGPFSRDKPVLVLGEGIYAADCALELLTYTADVTVCANGKQLTIPKDLLDQLADKNITIVPDKIELLEGSGGLERVVFADGSTRDAFSMFVAMGEASTTSFAKTIGLEQDDKGSIKVDEMMHTNMPGIFAAGDCVGRFKQIAVAVGEGALAAREAITYVKQTCPKEK